MTSVISSCTSSRSVLSRDEEELSLLRSTMTRLEPDEASSECEDGMRLELARGLSSGPRATFAVSLKTYVSSDARSASKLRPMRAGGFRGEVWRELLTLAIEGRPGISALAEAKDAIVLAVSGLA